MNKIYRLLLATVFLSITSCSTTSSNVVDTASPTYSPAKTDTSTRTAKPVTPTRLPKTVTPTITASPMPVIDSAGNITWHPSEVLVLSEGGGGDGVSFDYPPNFLLLWDGTLFQKSETEFGLPYISQLEDEEVCKILNTINSSGFFEEPRDYQFPFDGLGSSYISVNGWKINSSGGQILSYALSGAPFYDGLFCRNCPIPSPQTIIKPGLANVSFLLKNYYSPTRQLATVQRLLVYLEYVEEDAATRPWPLTVITGEDFIKKCEDTYCYDAGMILDGEIAREVVDKISPTDIFNFKTSNGVFNFKLRYRHLWPYEPSIMYSNSENFSWKEIPADYSRTCNPSMGTYPLLPLSSQNEFWYYAQDGKWGAEVIKTDSQPEKIRIVSNFGYEKVYEYAPELFGREAVKVYPRYWTEDGSYFFANILPKDYNSTETPFINSIGIQRISITDGKIDYLFIGTEGQGYAYEISEENLQAAYIRQGDTALKIVLKDVFSLREVTATLIPPSANITYTDAGSIVWSLDGKSIFVATNYKEGNQDKSVILKIDTNNPTIQSIIYQNTKAIKLVLRSEHEHYAHLCSLKANIESNCSFQLDLETGIVDR